MSRLILPQFNEREVGLPDIVDRSLDAEEIDNAFALVARRLNGGLDNDNIGETFSTRNDNPNSFPNAFVEPYSITSLCVHSNVAAETPSIRLDLGATGGGVWRPLKVSIVLSKLSGAYQGNATCTLYVAGAPDVAISPAAALTTPASVYHDLPTTLLTKETAPVAELRNMTDMAVAPNSLIFANITNVCGPLMIYATFKTPRFA